MKAAAFDYQRAHSLAEATAALQAAMSAAKPLGGGQSLGPMLNLRLTRPALLVDLSGLDEMRAVNAGPDGYWIGGALTHAEIEDGMLDTVLAEAPGLAALLRHVAAGIAYRAIRNRGTLAGSLAHADPAADWMLAMMALNAQLQCVGAHGSRWVGIDAFMSGAFTTALADGEVLAGVRVARCSASMRWGYYKFCRKTGEFAQASCAAVFDPVHGTARIVLGALDGAPAPLPQLAGALARQGAAALAGDAVRDAVCQAAGTEDPVRLQLMVAAVQRCLKQVMEG
ncbi:MAG: aerobic carbon-monoxide dehydrogenase medium subunit [Massilia sp.]